jgi:hypothetical protein
MAQGGTKKQAGQLQVSCSGHCHGLDCDPLPEDMLGSVEYYKIHLLSVPSSCAGQELLKALKLPD